ncbi:MAG TPA: ATP synthase subunit I [Rhodanobacteraceae bacterium]|nr:ATP synthase subunit I [Rhodanobacteraceae bacterium]
MRNSIAAGRHQAARLLGWQTVAALGVAVLFLTDGTRAALAALFGGAVVVLPSAWFALKVFARPAGEDPRRVLGVFYVAEAAKVFMMALGFWLGTLWFGGDYLPLLVAGLACFVVNWAMLGAVKKL